MKPEPFNPFYWLLVLASLAFVVTALPVAILLAGVPIDSPEWFLRNDWRILLVEAAAIVVFGLLSMGLDRWRRWRRGETPPVSTLDNSVPMGENKG